MAGDNYRASFKDITHLNHLAGHPPGIHVNKSFIEDPNGWIQLSNNLQLQSGAHTTMYNNAYPNSGYSNAYPNYQQTYTGGYNYQGYANQYTVGPTSQPMPPSDAYQQNSTWHSVDYGAQGKAEERQDAIAQEMEQQRAQLTKQREDYVKKVAVLRHELEQLRNQKQELMNDGSSDRDLAMILRENDKLQEEILGKMKAIYNVIEMLSSIIKDGKSLGDLEEEMNSQSHCSPEVTESFKEEKSSPPAEEETISVRSSKKYCYVFYDTGLHWCRSCDEFPETAKEFLQHLQSDPHKETAKENEVDTTPWHKLPTEPILPSYDDAPKKRIPIKGLQFFIPAPAWYCKLCDVWIGDLHCASHHLKSQTHFQNYENFVQQNPHWEMEWLKDREKAMARGGDSDDAAKRKRQKRRSLEKLLSKKMKKKKSKKRRKHSSDSSSSSSSSDSSSEDEKEDRSKSIRVAMRNMPKVQHIMNEDMSKWNVLEKILQEHRKKEEEKKEAEKKDPHEKEDELINQWMTVTEPYGKEKSMIESLKDRMRMKQELEKQKYLEMEKRRKEKEREEQEAMERKQREAQEEQEKLERERKRKEQEEFQRLTDRERNQVRFRTARENYRKRRSNSGSGDDERYRSERSPSHRYRKDSEHSNRSHDRSPSQSRRSEEKKKPPGPPSYKKLPFIGRMPLFKNKKADEKPAEPKKEIKKEEYEPQRRTRFEPGNLPRAFIPQPDVVRFPQLSSIPPLAAPPPPPVVSKIPSPPPKVPEPPKITPPKAPPAPEISKEEDKKMTIDEENLYSETGPEMDPNMMGQYYQDYTNMMYSQGYDFPQGGDDGAQVPLAHTMPLEPPPLPPDDDLAMLGMCADDMAAQSF